MDIEVCRNRQHGTMRVLVMPRESVGSWSAAGERQDCVSTDRCMLTSVR